MELNTRLEAKARELGATYFGAADLSAARQGPLPPYEQRLVREFPFAVSVGVPLLPSVVDRLGDQSDVNSLLNYYFHYYEVVNSLINQITLRLSHMLDGAGYAALPIPATLVVDTDNSYGVFSNKLAASLSGLGWIGKNCLLITPDRGPRVRWGTILTDAPLSCGQMVAQRCGSCTICVEACPAEAFSGRNFDPAEGREMRMTPERCCDFEDTRRRQLGYPICGMCMYICPWGRDKGTT
jgi:epoxyqueuosine reductase QueG